MDALRKDLDERYGIEDYLYIGGDVHPTEELVPLEPGGGVLLVYFGGENLSESLLCSIEVSCRLHVDRRGGQPPRIFLCEGEVEVVE